MAVDDEDLVFFSEPYDNDETWGGPAYVDVKSKRLAAWLVRHPRFLWPFAKWFRIKAMLHRV